MRQHLGHYLGVVTLFADYGLGFAALYKIRRSSRTAQPNLQTHLITSGRYINISIGMTVTVPVRMGVLFSIASSVTVYQV